MDKKIGKESDMISTSWIRKHRSGDSCQHKIAAHHAGGGKAP